MKIKQISGFAVLLALSGVTSISMAPVTSADPQTTSVKCSDGKTVQANKAMKPDASILDDKDYAYACRNNGGYKKIDETIVCKDDKMHNVYKTAADPKDKLTQADREAACKSFGGIKKDVNSEPEPSGSTGSSISNPIEGNGCAGVKTAFIKCNEKNSGAVEDNGIWALLIMVLNILTAGVGIVAVAGIVYGSILYTTAEDKADQVQKAISIIRNVVIGLVLFALMWAGLNFIVPGGVFLDA